MSRITKLGLVVALALMATAPAFSTQIFITEFTKNVSLSSYCSCYPTGAVSDGNAYGTGTINYSIVNAPASSNNIQFIGGPAFSLSPPSGTAGAAPNDPVTASDFSTDVSARSITSPIAIYLLMNIFAPVDGQPVAQVSVFGSGGASAVFDLATAQHLRNFWLGGASNTAPSSADTKNVFTSVSNASGNFGQSTYSLDEIRLVLPASFIGQTLQSIDVSLVADNTLAIGGNGHIMLEAITVDGTIGGGGNTNPTPEPASFAMAFGGAAILWLGRKQFVR